MTRERPTDLPYPTCAQCEGIGLSAGPDWQYDLEDDLGFDVLKALLIAYGGREMQIRKSAEPATDALGHALAWMSARFGAGKITVQFGPLARKNRVAWLIYTMLRDGASLAQVAGAANTS
ncbi:hypothetical protein, partial [Roseinatronobacter sp.]|uniref:hypothetical protein n=1 Tax=Roseinatronobacter sp. TaxID=1945755 RepID=UPI0025E3037E